MADKKISELSSGSTPDGTEKIEVVQAGSNVQLHSIDIGIIREINRAFVEDLIFDKHEITMAAETMTANINFTVNPIGLIDQFCCMRTRIIADGIHAITFTSDFNFIYGIINGQILAAGSYQIYFLYLNGSVTVNVPGVTAESSTITQLIAPANFSAVPGAGDPETEIDLTWDDVTNESSYELQFSDSGGGGPWQSLTEPAANATSYTHTGLTPGTTYHYRIRAIGDGVSFSDSPFTIDATTTESGSDVTAPTFTFTPTSGVTDWPVNDSIVITANETIRNTDGSDLTNANIAAVLILKENNSGGANIPFTATIDVSKTIITITPTTSYGGNQLVYVAINNVEDVNGNEVTVAISSTFTTTGYTIFNGTSNVLIFGDIMDGVFGGTDKIFKILVTVDEMTLSGTRIILSKYSATDNQRSFYFYHTGSDVYFSWAKIGTSAHRVIKWAGALSAGEHDLELDYDGSIDTNDGLDRCIFKVDGATAGSKTLFFTDSTTLGDIYASTTSQLAFGAGVNNAGTVTAALYFSGKAKDLIVLSGVGDTEELNVPVLREGTDTSGNARDGVWV